MSEGTLGRIQYRIRPAKNMERKMLCEAIGRLERLRPIRDYQYVGFGALEFHDFSLFFERLGFQYMISIEKRVDEKARVIFNKPYGHISMKWGESHRRLPEISFQRPTIIWLDYDDPLNANILEDVELVTAKVQSGSIFVITVTAHPKPMHHMKEGEDVHTARLNDLKEKVGQERLPSGLNGKDLAKWGLARVSRRIVYNEIVETVAKRSEAANPLSYHQLFNFRYADGVRMLSTGGIILSESDAEILPPSSFDDLRFVRRDEAAFEIKVPLLTLREARWLSQRFPNSLSNLKKIPSREVERYRAVHRYFPAFTEIEFT